MFALPVNTQHAARLGKVGALVTVVHHALVHRLNVVPQAVMAGRLVAALVARQPNALVHKPDVILETLRGGGLVRALVTRVAHPLMLVLLVFL
jgi:hypothetical protein